MPPQEGRIDLAGLDDEENIAALKASIEALDGVESVVIETQEDTALVAYDDARVNMADILARVEEASRTILPGEE